jgi:hypothetical protein
VDKVDTMVTMVNLMRGMAPSPNLPILTTGLATEKKKKKKKKYTVARERLCGESLGKYWSRMAELDEEAGARGMSTTYTLPMGSTSTKAKHHRSYNVVMKEGKSKYHWNTCFVGDCTLLTDEKDGLMCWTILWRRRRPP